MDIGTFFSLAFKHPWGIIAVIVNLGVVFVNGWTDGPSTISTIVTSRALTPKKAIIMCAICNLIGVITIGVFASYIAKFAGGDVSQTIASLVSWGDASVDLVLCAITFGLVSIVLTSIILTRLSLPSSQSNCLVGGITGAGLALMALNHGGSIGMNPWIKVIIGFVGSLIFGFIFGFLFTILIQKICKKMNKGKTTRFFVKGQIATGAVMSFMHGLQDGAKFIGVFILIAATLGASNGGNYAELIVSLAGTPWIYLPVAAFLFFGTILSNTSIIKTMGKGMAILKKYQAFATDIAASLGILLATLFGLPLSTGTVKSTAIMGGGSARSIHRVKWDVAGKMVLWGALTFPISALIGFLGVMMFFWTC